MAEDFFARLKQASGGEWMRYIDHPFVRGIGDGSLPQAAFRYYLVQDYIFLMHFARAYALGVFKASTLADMRESAEAVWAIVDGEMELHVGYCAEWGMTREDMEAAPEDGANLAYTRYVLERGLAGDALDLHVALAPCVVGYAEIGMRLAPHVGQENPYARWVAMYAGDDYQEVARKARARLDRLSKGISAERAESLAQTFTTATRLEVGFWQMGLDAA